MRVQRWLAVLVVAVAACSAPAASSLAPATFEEFATNACDAFEAMFRAVGNPDAGTDSELSKALDEAVQRGDPAEAGRLAEAITVELESGRQSASQAAAWPPGFAMMNELDRVLLAFEAMVDAKRQAAGNSARAGPAGGVRGGRRRHLVAGDVRGRPGDTSLSPGQPAPARMRGHSDELVILVRAPLEWTPLHEPGTCRFHGTGRASR